MKTLILFILLFFIYQLYAQKPIIDKVIAVVGNNAILYSDVENQYIQMLNKEKYEGIDLKCSIFEELVYQNLLLHQAEMDSVTVSDKEVESEMDRRLRYFINQVGGEKKLESYFNKSIIEIKSDLRKSIRKQMIAERMQDKIVGKIKVTPTDVRNFYKSLPEDSIPVVDEQYEYQQIVIYPVVSEKDKLATKEKIEEIRKRILNGEDFTVLAVLYSEDPGTAMKGGELGFFSRNEMVPEFSAAAFKLKEGEVSPVVETDFGYHIIQLIERRGEQINARHILLTVKGSYEEQIKAQRKIEDIYKKILADSISFSKAVTLYSMDKATANNQGLAINPYTQTTKIEKNFIDPATLQQLEKLSVGQVSPVFEFYDEKGKKGYKIVKLKAKYSSHKANLKDDYYLLQQLAQEHIRQETIKKWVERKMKNTYITIDEDFKKCDFNLIKL
jgi:peptidyl-prolyl cis-trans isomerase SurA